MVEYVGQVDEGGTLLSHRSSPVVCIFVVVNFVLMLLYFSIEIEPYFGLRDLFDLLLQFRNKTLPFPAVDDSIHKWGLQMLHILDLSLDPAISLMDRRPNAVAMCLMPCKPFIEARNIAHQVLLYILYLPPDFEGGAAPALRLVTVALKLLQCLLVALADGQQVLLGGTCLYFPACLLHLKQSTRQFLAVFLGDTLGWACLNGTDCQRAFHF